MYSKECIYCEPTDKEMLRDTDLVHFFKGQSVLAEGGGINCKEAQRKLLGSQNVLYLDSSDGFKGQIYQNLHSSQVHFNGCKFYFFCPFAFSRAAPAAYGGSQARDQIGAVAAGLRQSHSNARSEHYLQPTPQLIAMPDP